MKDNLLYIGLNGYAGSGKDTVAKMLRTILSKDWNSLEECKEFYKSYYKNPTISATYNKNGIEDNSPVFSIAFADQLKNICSSIFGIPVERLYQNKETSWIAINKDFHYTEIKPMESQLITAEEYYNNVYNYMSSQDAYYMSLREVLVYVGTYVLQRDINKQVFVNIITNKIREQLIENNNLNYVIVTDVRFPHEFDWIKKNHGVVITITRNDVAQLDNIAEHSLDGEDENSWDYIIENNAGYDELFEAVWDMAHTPEFLNDTVDLQTRDNINNYMRYRYTEDGEKCYKLCFEFSTVRVSRSDGEISMVDPSGGPAIYVGMPIPGTDLVPNRIIYNEIKECYELFVDED